IMGEAGVGKTRLLRELADHLADRPEGPIVREGRCPAYGAGLAYWALSEVVRGQFDIADTDDSDAAWAKLHAGIEAMISHADTDEPPARLAAAIARPLGIEAPDDAAGDEDPQQMRDRMFSALRTVIEAASRRR